MSKSFNIHMASVESKSFKAAADICGLSLSSWIRERLRKAAIVDLREAGKDAEFLLEQPMDFPAHSDRSSRKHRDHRAREWLIERFREKTIWPSSELFKLATADGIGRNAMFEAKKLLGFIQTKRNLDPECNMYWTWLAPPDWEERNEKNNDE